MSDYFEEEDDVDPFADRSYEVGYGKPPKQHQFKKGNNAASNRRKKQQARVRETLFRHLNRKVTIPGKNGKNQRVSKLEAMITVLLHQALKSPKDSLRLLSWAIQNEPDVPVVDPEHKVTIEFVNSKRLDLPGALEEQPELPSKK